LTLKTISFQEFLESLKRRGFTIHRNLRRQPSIFAKFSYSDAIIRFKAVVKITKETLKEITKYIDKQKLSEYLKKYPAKFSEKIRKIVKL